MSLATETGDGPHGPETLVTISKRTVITAAIAGVMIIFSLLTIVWVMRGVYTDARDDARAAREEAQCARDVNSESIIAIGEHQQELGALSEQIGKVFIQLPTLQADPAAFRTAIGEFGPISAELHRLTGLLDVALGNQAQVNAICVDPPKENPSGG